MHDEDARRRLVAGLQELESRDPLTLSRDDQDSLTCWRIEQRLRKGLRVEVDANRGLVAWVTTLLDVDTFITIHGEIPRENNRRTQDKEERRLASWLRYQRRRGVEGQLCTYQRLSLEATEGFMWAPGDTAWDNQFDAYKNFLELERRVPRYRSASPTERQLAAWAAKQRLAHTRGRLDESRIDRLNTLSIRILPTRRR